MKNRKYLILSTLLCLLPIVYGIIIYNQLPADIAIHWDVNNNPNGYAPRAVAVFLLPVFMAAINVITNVGMDKDPKADHVSKSMRLIVRLLIPIISIVACSITLIIAQGYSVNVGQIITLLVGIVFFFVGNYLPKCRQNTTVGIRTAWTLSSEENWNKTHRLAGYLWIICGIAVIVMGLLNEFRPMVPIILIMVLVPFIYSFIIFNKENK